MILTFTRINDHYQLYALTEPLVQVSHLFKKVKTGVARLTTYQSEGVNFYTFGLNAFENKPDHGGEWSSNSDYINEVFGTDIIECAVQENTSPYLSYSAMACEKSFIKSVAPKTLEYRSGKLYQILDYPKGDDYCSSTTIDKDGNLTWPTVESMMIAIDKYKSVYNMSEDDERIKHMRCWIARLKHVKDRKLVAVCTD